jgi:hypothetical protein
MTGCFWVGLPAATPTEVTAIITAHLADVAIRARVLFRLSGFYVRDIYLPFKTRESFPPHHLSPLSASKAHRAAFLPAPGVPIILQFFRLKRSQQPGTIHL